MTYEVVFELRNVAEGDVVSFAQQVWNKHAESFDASKDEFDVWIRREGTTLDWGPETG